MVREHTVWYNGSVLIVIRAMPHTKTGGAIYTYRALHNSNNKDDNSRELSIRAAVRCTTFFAVTSRFTVLLSLLTSRKPSVFYSTVVRHEVEVRGKNKKKKIVSFDALPRSRSRSLNENTPNPIERVTRLSIIGKRI